VSSEAPAPGPVVSFRRILDGVFVTTGTMTLRSYPRMAFPGVSRPATVKASVATSSRDSQGQAALKSEGRPPSKCQRGPQTLSGKREERLPRSLARCRGLAGSTCNQRICRMLRPSKARSGGLLGGFQGGPFPCQPGRGRRELTWLPSSMGCRTAAGALCEAGDTQTTFDGVFGWHNLVESTHA